MHLTLKTIARGIDSESHAINFAMREIDEMVHNFVLSLLFEPIAFSRILKEIKKKFKVKPWVNFNNTDLL